MSTATVDHWVAVVGLPDLGALAAAESGVNLEHLALVPQPGADTVAVMGALLDGFALVAVAASALPGGQAGHTAARRLATRARDRGVVLLGLGGWPVQPDLEIAATGTRWAGLAEGHGHLRDRELEFTVRGRGGAVRPVSHTLRLPLETGAPALVADLSSRQHDVVDRVRNTRLASRSA
jgi:hypothetical protein